MLGANTLVRFSYAKVFEPESFEGGEPKYSVAILIPKSDKATLGAVKKGLQAAVEMGREKFGDGFKAPNSGNHFPLRDGDEKDNPEYKDHYYINAKSKRKPAIIDRKKQPIIDDEDAFYSGCYGRVSVEFYPYSRPSKGIAAGLGNIMKVQDGDRLGGGYISADDDFKEFEAIEADDKDEDDNGINFDSDGGMFSDDAPF